MTMLLEALRRSTSSSSYVVEWQMGDQGDPSAAANEGQPGAALAWQPSERGGDEASP